MFILKRSNEKVGSVKIYDLQKGIFLFNWRIEDDWYGHGYYSQALRLVAKYVFELEK